MDDDSSPKTTRNMNFAMLFNTESESRRYAKRNGIPEDYESVFIPVAIKQIENPSQTKKYYNVLNRGNLSDDMPSFLR